MSRITCHPANEYLSDLLTTCVCRARSCSFFVVHATRNSCIKVRAPGSSGNEVMHRRPRAWQSAMRTTCRPVKAQELPGSPSLSARRPAAHQAATCCFLSSCSLRNWIVLEVGFSNTHLHIHGLPACDETSVGKAATITA